MPYPAPIIRITHGGRLPGGEQWQCGFSYGNSNTPTSLPFLRGSFTDMSLEDIGTAITAFYATTSLKLGSRVYLDWVKAALILQDGSYDEATEGNPRELDITGAAGGDTSYHPENQRSLAVTLHSGATLGKGNYGRFYLPPMGFDTDAATGLISTTDGGNVLAAVVTMLEAVKGEVDTLTTEMHQVIPTEVGSVNKVVQEVRIGRVFDTQRRRRSAVPESYLIDNTVDL